MNRKIVQTETLLTRIQNQLFEGKKESAFQKDPERNKQPKVQPKKKTYGAAFSSAQLKSRSSEKPTQKSDSFENLFSKKIDQGLSKKAQRSEQLPEKLHESFSHQPVEQHSQQKNATKSLYFTEFHGASESTKQGAQKNMKIFDYFQKYSDLLNRCNPKPSSNKQTGEGEVPGQKNRQMGLTTSQFEQFKIDDINSLIDLIDSCVQEANAYIRDLSTKVEVMQDEINQLRKTSNRMDEFNKVHLSIIKEKDQIIERLSAERNKKQPSSKNQDIKNLLKMIEQLNEENATLRDELDTLKTRNIQQAHDSDKKGKEIYNEIHRKIEILNIAVTQKPRQEEQRSVESDSVKGGLDDIGERDSFNATNSRTSEGNKRYKYIRPKS